MVDSRVPLVILGQAEGLMSIKGLLFFGIALMSL